MLDRCLVCRAPLLEDGTQYLIEKAFARGEVIFEYALCLNCRAGLEGELSRRSLKLIAHYFEEHVDVAGRGRRLLQLPDEGVRPWLDHCLVKRTAIDPAGEFQVFALCDGKDLLCSLFPYAISGAALEDVMKLLSPQTKGFLDGFTGRYLGAPDGANLPTILPV